MANEKLFNVRLGLKIDTLEAWNTSTLPLKKGEVAFATVAATAGTGLTEPVVMAKICTEDGKTFNELPWAFHAKSSDVLAACKTEAGLKAFINNVIDEAGIATNDALTALTGRVATAEGKIDTLNGTGDGSVAKAISDAIAALNLANTYDAKGAAADALAQAKTYADGKDTAIAAAKKAGDDAQADVDALEAKVGTVPADKTVVQMISDAQTAATYDDTALKGRVSANETAIATLNGTGEGSVSKQVADAVAGIVNDAPEAYNTLKEISDWISSHAGSAAEMNSQINTNKDDIAALEALVGTLPEGVDSTTVVGYINEAISDLKIGDYAKAADLASAVSRISTNETEISTIKNTTIPAAQAAAEKHADDAIAALGIADYVKKADADKAYDAIGAAEAVQGNTTETVESVNVKVGTAQSKADSAYTLAEGKATMAEVNTAIANAGHAAAKDLTDHTGNTTVHITAAERTKWNAAEGNAKTYADGLNTAMNTRVEALEAVDHSHSNKTVLDGITAAKVTAWDNAEKNAKDYADGLADNYDEAGAAEAVRGELNTYKGTNDAALALKANDADLATVAKSGLIDDLTIGAGTTLVFDCGNSVV